MKGLKVRPLTMKKGCVKTQNLLVKMEQLEQQQQQLPSTYATSLDNRSDSGGSNQAGTTSSEACLEDLPRVIQLAVKFSAASNNLIFLPVAATAAMFPCLMFMSITQNFVMGIVMGTLCFFSFMQTTLHPNLTLQKNSLFIEILAEKPEEAAKNIQIAGGVNVILWALVLPPIVFAFLIVPILGEAGGADGLHLASDAVLWGICIVCMFGQVLVNAMQSMGFLILEVQKTWCRKIRAYLSFVRDALVEESSSPSSSSPSSSSPSSSSSSLSAGLEDGHTGKDIMRRIAFEQQKYENWAKACNVALSTTNTVMPVIMFLWTFVPLLLLAAPANDTALRTVQLSVLSMMSIFFMSVLLMVLKAITKPSTEWTVVKREMLNDARVRNAPYKICKHNQFEAWLADHELNAMRGIAGVKVSVEKLRAAGGFVASLFLLSIYLILREDLQKALIS